jgi:hypothetical protein
MDLLPSKIQKVVATENGTHDALAWELGYSLLDLNG